MRKMYFKFCVYGVILKIYYFKNDKSYTNQSINFHKVQACFIKYEIFFVISECLHYYFFQGKNMYVSVSHLITFAECQIFCSLFCFFFDIDIFNQSRCQIC